VEEAGRSSGERGVANVIDKVDDFFEWHLVVLDTPNVSEVAGCGRIVVNVPALVDSEKDYMLKVVAEDLL
jgi:hypothetical protein